MNVGGVTGGRGRGLSEEGKEQWRADQGDGDESKADLSPTTLLLHRGTGGRNVGGVTGDVGGFAVDVGGEKSLKSQQNLQHKPKISSTAQYERFVSGFRMKKNNFGFRMSRHSESKTWISGDLLRIKPTFQIEENTNFRGNELNVWCKIPNNFGSMHNKSL